MIPLFTSHYSIGKSILTLSKPKEESEGSDSIFSIAKKENLKKIYLVEDSLTGLPQAISISEDLGIQLIFGLRMSVCDPSHKIIVFARNSNGCRLLNKIFSLANAGQKHFDIDELKSVWNSNELEMAIPFYDSFLYQNIMTFNTCAPDLKPFKPTIFLENNKLPFDLLISQKASDYAKLNSLETQNVKSIRYYKNSDVESFQTYKCICNRRFGQRSLSKPGLDHFGSDLFSFESYASNEA